MKNIVKIEKNCFNNLKKNHQILNKNLVNLDENKFSNEVLEIVSLVNNSVGNLNNIIQNCNLKLQRINKGEEKLDTEINEILKNEREAEEIIKKFIPLMMMYQIKNNI